MTDFTTLLEVACTVALVAIPIIGLSRALAGSDGASLADIFAFPAGSPLPRGVQEEEPVRYRVERLSRSRARAVPVASGACACQRVAPVEVPTPFATS